MFSFFTEHHFMPCDKCGASLAFSEREFHVCNPERRLDYELLQLREEIDGFEEEFRAFLRSPLGRFELWDAERRRLRPA